MGSFYAYNSRRQVMLQRKEARNQIIFGMITAGLGIVQTYYTKTSHRDDTLLRILNAKIAKPTSNKVSD